MFNPLKGLGDLNEMRKQAGQMQKLLEKEEVIVEENGIKVIVRGDQKIREVIVDGVLENRITNALNTAIGKTRELAGKKLMEINK